MKIVEDRKLKKRISEGQNTTQAEAKNIENMTAWVFRGLRAQEPEKRDVWEGGGQISKFMM